MTVLSRQSEGAIIRTALFIVATVMLMETLAFTSQQLIPGKIQTHSDSIHLDSQLSTKLVLRSSASPEDVERKSGRRCQCPPDDEEKQENDEELSTLDRREAAFAMLGALWSAGVIPVTDRAANAVYGADANMDFPNVMEGLSNRNNKQCLVESLGNRECLVYREDEDKLLYKGADADLLLKKIEKASSALEQIPELVGQKKWTQVTGVLTGPMGELSSTLTALVKLSDNADAPKLAQKVKTNCFAMGTGVSNKNADVVLKAHDAATKDLVVFLRSL